MHLSRVALVSLLALSACYPFVSNNLITSQTCSVDADGDGETLCGEGTEVGDGDCDDNNAEKSHLLTEIPADGWDNDCSEGDLVDVDGDGYPRITQADHAALGRDPYPAIDNPDVLDCDDDDGAVYPNNPNEKSYDGVDSNCDGKCDYDADEDGFADRILGKDNDCGLPATDCLDSDAGVSPSVTVDVAYNGEDEDCDGANDFDPDGDGYIWAAYRAELDIYLDKYKYTDDTIGDTECFDAGDTDVGATTDEINGGASEIWRNGVDDDCSDIVDGEVTNDFDRDGDGYMRTADRANFLAYVSRFIGFKRQGPDNDFPYKAMFEAEFGGTTSAHQAYFDARDNDCNDDDATVHPQGIEKLGDSVDQDCDGHNDTTRFVFPDSVSLSGLGNPRLATTDNHFVLLANADKVDGTERVYALSFPVDGDNTSDSQLDPAPYSGSGLGLSIALIGQPEGYLTAFAWNPGSGSRLRTEEAESTTVGSNYRSSGNNEIGPSGSFNADVAEIDLRCDGDTCWQVACDGTSLYFMHFKALETIEASGQGLGAVDCVTFGDTIVGVSASGAVAGYTVKGDLTLASASTAFGGLSVDNVSSHDDWLFIGKKGGGVRLHSDAGAKHDVLSGSATTHGDVVFQASTAYVVAVVGGQVVLGYGAPSSMTEVVVPFVTADGTKLDAEYVAIEVDGDRVMISAVNDDGDQLGWAFFAI